MNEFREIKQIYEKLEEKSFCIYGAGIVAASVYTAIKTLYNEAPLFFLISDTTEGKSDKNPTEIDGIAVKRLSEWKKELQAYGEPDGDTMNIVLPGFYLVLAPETHHPMIAASLHSLCIEDSHIYLFTNELENKIMEEYYRSLDGYKTVLSIEGADINGEAGRQRELKRLERLEDIQVFQAKCHVDVPLSKPMENPVYVSPIQVGADLTDEVITKLQDNEGSNISAKNRNYCELTAAYYAWKNSCAKYKGLCHYRRIFDISDAQMQKLLERNREWDVILPYPTIHYPDMRAEHKRYIKDNDWQAMLKAMKELTPGYYDAYVNNISKEQYFYNYNMLIAKAEVFDDYCAFMFNVLARTEELTTPKGWERSDRFAGYLGENLTTIYFSANREKMKIVHAGKLWLT